MYPLLLSRILLINLLEVWGWNNIPFRPHLLPSLHCHLLHYSSYILHSQSGLWIKWDRVNDVVTVCFQTPSWQRGLHLQHIIQLYIVLLTSSLERSLGSHTCNPLDLGNTVCICYLKMLTTLYNVMCIRVLTLYQVRSPVCGMKVFAFFAAVILFLLYSPL